MAAVSTFIAVGGLALSAVGTVKGIQADKKISKADKRKEDLRKEEARVDKIRRERQILRQTQVSRANILTQGSNNLGTVGSSGQSGAIAEVQANSGFENKDLNDKFARGAETFKLNSEIADSRSEKATGQGLSSLGGAIFTNSKTISNVGQSLFGTPKRVF